MSYFDSVSSGNNARNLQHRYLTLAPLTASPRNSAGLPFSPIGFPAQGPASRTNNWKTRMLIDLNARLTGYLERGEPYTFALRAL